MKTYVWILLGVLVIILLGITGKKVKSIMDYNKEFSDGLRALKKAGYTKEQLQYLEKIYRLETNHFKSGQFKGTFSPGMEKFDDTFPYGWNTINKVVWSSVPAAKPIGFLPYTENGTGKTKYFLKFPSLLAAMTTVAGFIKYYNTPARWYSTKADAQARYLSSLNKIKTPLTDEIYA